MKIVMSRPTRLLIDELERYAKMSDVQGLITPAHVYLGDILMCKYYQNPVINLVKSRISKIPKTRREWKHFTVSYWYPIVDNMLREQAGPKRENVGIIYGEMSDYNPFHHIIRQYLLTDYSIFDAVAINNIVNEYAFAEITAACRSAAQANVYNVRYIKAILEAEKAKKQLQAEKISALGQKIDSSDRLLGQDKITYTKDEVKKAEETFEEKRHNMLLELMLQNMFGGDKSDTKR